MSIAAALLPLALAVLQETRSETWPDGTRKAEYSVTLGEDGNEVRQGPYRSWFEDGTLESTGTFEKGEREGPWEFFHPNGAKAASGRFAGGLESGPWETWYPNGERESRGSYVRGARSKRWDFWDENGKKDLAESGLYRIEVYRGDGRHYRGYFVDNKRQGPWSSYWPDGRSQLSGRFEEGARQGPWLFAHPDGVPSSLLLTGQYEAGAWVGRVEVPPPPPFDASLFPPIEPAPGGWPAQRKGLEASLRGALEKRALEKTLAQELGRVGIPAIPIALVLLAELDPESAAGRDGIGFLENEVLRPLCSHHALSSHGRAGPPDALAARELVRAWLSLWALTATDEAFWRTSVPGPASGVGLRDVLQDPPLLERDPRYDPDALVLPVAAEAEVEETPIPAAYAARFGRERSERLRGAPSGTEDAIEDALDWLVAHQGENGSWDMDGFMAQCGHLGKGTCSGAGAATHDVGATGLVLLALLGDGHTPNRGKHRERVTRALDWLVKQQEPRTGLLGERLGHDFMYDHMIATCALCEGLALGGTWLREAAGRALAVVQQARNPNGAWRYDLPPNGQNDTSITGWAVHALVAAGHAGLEVDPDAFVGAQRWIEKVTDPGSGRVGYSALGELSSRSPANEQFPREKGEAMTAVGLWIRLQLGQRPATELLQTHAALIAAKPPSTEPDAIDHYYWFYGSSALHAMGGKTWKVWEDATKVCIRGTQEGRGDAKGSWEPNGAWGFAMGRVGSTALLTLALECYVRE